MIGFYFLLFIFSFGASCNLKPADVRTMMPGDSLVYLESNDLGAVMKTITDRPAFREAAKFVPDFSELNGVKLAISVTGFETKEEPVTEENAVFKFVPHFVAAIETNAWNFQAKSFTENQLGEFINHVYGGEVLLETSNKYDGNYYVWSSNDGRKAYALIQGSVILFGNDESSIEKALAVKRGEADSIAKNPKITDGDRLAFGYVSEDGVAQLSNILGLHLAVGASDRDDIRQYISILVPKMLRTSIEEVSWTARSVEDGVEDTFDLRTRNDLGKTFAETLSPSSGLSSEGGKLHFIPAEAISATRYDLKDPQLAWRSVLLSAGANTDQPSADIIAMSMLSQALEPYGIEDEKTFLSSTKGLIYSIRFDPDDQEIAVVGNVGNRTGLLKSVARELKTSVAPVKEGDAEIWRSDDGFALVVLGDEFLLGDSNAVQKCLASRTDTTLSAIAERFRTTLLGATSFTVSRNSDSASRLADVVADRSDKESVNVESRVWTDFKTDHVERRELSDFGLIGWFLTQFAKDQD